MMTMVASSSSSSPSSLSSMSFSGSLLVLLLLRICFCCVCVTADNEFRSSLSVQKIVPGEGEPLVFPQFSEEDQLDNVVTYRPCPAAVDDDNNILVIGWTWRTAFVYRRDGESWAKHSKITLPIENKPLVRCVIPAVSGDTIALGVPYEYNSSKEKLTGSVSELRGSVYVFVRNDHDEWTQQALVIPKDNADDEHFMFGTTVNLEGDRLVVGAGSGPTLVFHRSGTEWFLQGELPHSKCVAVYGDRIFLDGVLQEDKGDMDIADGSIFRLENDVWTRETELFSRDGLPTYALALGDDIAIKADNAGTLSVFSLSSMELPKGMGYYDNYGHWVNTTDENKNWELQENVDILKSNNIAKVAISQDKTILISTGWGIAQMFRFDPNVTREDFDDEKQQYKNQWKLTGTLNITQETNGTCCRGLSALTSDTLVFGTNELEEAENHYTVHYAYTMRTQHDDLAQSTSPLTPSIEHPTESSPPTRAPSLERDPPTPSIEHPTESSKAPTSSTILAKNSPKGSTVRPAHGGIVACAIALLLLAGLVLLRRQFSTSPPVPRDYRPVFRDSDGLVLT